MMQVLIFSFLSLFFLVGCSQTSNPEDITDTGAGPQGTSSVLSKLKVKADPTIAAQIKKQEEEAKLQALKEQEAMQKQAEANNQAPVKANLPVVSNSPFASSVFQSSTSTSASVSGNPSPQASSAQPSFWPFGGGEQAPQQQPQTAMYGSYGGYGGGGGMIPPPPPNNSGNGFVPPPPAMLNTQAQMAPQYGGFPGIPFFGGQQQQQPANMRGQNSPFGSGNASGENTFADIEKNSKKTANFVPITPKGMESRSAFKQRDELRILFKGALVSSGITRQAGKDQDLLAALNKLDVGLPVESSRGSLNVSPRQIDQIFKGGVPDKRLNPQVKRLQSELAQAYYRYLYAFNKFALTQQTVAARKQELDASSTPAEQQRAAADLSAAQSEADSAKEDMRASQYELASIAGVQSARTVIGKVSGVTPSADSLAQASSPATDVIAENEPQDKGGGILGSVGSIFKFGKGGGSDKPQEDPKPAKEPKQAKEPKPKKEKSTQVATALTPAPVNASATGNSSSVPKVSQPRIAAQTVSESPISFQLKGVSVLPRKSVLQVSLKNNGENSFSFDPEVISISENNRKISDASISTDFSTTLIQPSQEVSGVITIYGRPWSDRLSISLPSDGKAIVMRR